MTDRELLLKAAQAAGYQLHLPLMEQRAASCPESIALALAKPGATWWNPLDDDGDALRLAAALRIDVWFPGRGAVQAGTPGSPITTEAINTERCPNACTRRAIVRAAAAGPAK